VLGVFGGWGFGDGLTTRPNKRITAKKPQSTKLRIHVLPGTPFGNRKRKCKEIKISTWNTLSLYRTGSCQNLADVLKEYNITIAAHQVVRWTGTGQVKINDFTIYYKGLDDSHQFG
jgi:hypothetical protein